MKKDRSPHSHSLSNSYKDKQFYANGILIIQSQGKAFECLIDDIDANFVCRFRWNLNKGYAATVINGKTILMHRLILGVDDPEVQVDHRWHNKLDNRRASIRACTRSENRRNSQKHKKSQSVYKGVYRDGRYYHVQIMVNGKVVNLGRYRSEITAAKIYDHFARLFFKDFAYLNFPDFFEMKQLEIPGFQ